MQVLALGYVGVTSPEAKQWEDFGTELLGMQLADQDDDGAVRLRVDDRHHRLAIHPGERDRLEYLGWEVLDPEALDAARAELEGAGVAVEAGTDEVLAARRVVDLIVYTDPLGFRHEIFYGQLDLPGSFRPGRPLSGFVTGTQGLGHAVLIVPDLDAASGWYRSTMGFRMSDVVEGMFRLHFMHVNPRHHSLALMELPGMKGLQHLMVQVRSLDDVGLAYDLCQERGFDITLTLGRHTNDQMVSFYVRSPSGFDVEYGYGALEVDPAQWAVGQYDRPSIWGHHFKGTGLPGIVEDA